MLNNLKKKVEKKLDQFVDWVEEDRVRLYYVGVGIGVLSGAGIGYCVGSIHQYKIDAKSFRSFLSNLEEGFKEMQPKYLNLVDGTMDVSAAIGVDGRAGLKITSTDIYGEPLSRVITTSKEDVVELANELAKAAEEARF